MNDLECREIIAEAVPGSRSGRGDCSLGGKACRRGEREDLTWAGWRRRVVQEVAKGSASILSQPRAKGCRKRIMYIIRM